jgi:hypothetical protein
VLHGFFGVKEANNASCALLQRPISTRRCRHERSLGQKEVTQSVTD